MNYILILGAKSDIAKATAREYAKKGYSLHLAGRNIATLQGFANDIKLRDNVDVQLFELDVTDFASHKSFFNSVNPKPFGIIYVAGYMTAQNDCLNDFDETLNTINVNYTGAVSILNICANYLEENRSGFIVGVSSVAGDRGRKSNYIYGSSKAAFTAYLSGLRNRLYEYNINVLTVKPGFVNTKMTADLDLPAKLTAEPEDVARDIYSAQQKGKNILYTKSIWKLIMFIIKHIPENKFKKMSI